MGDPVVLSQIARLRTELDWVLAELRAGRLSGPEAEECLRSLSSEMPDGGSAFMVASDEDGTAAVHSRPNTLQKVGPASCC